MNHPWVYMCPSSWTPSQLPSHPIPQGCPSAPALNVLFHALNLDWWSISHMVIYMFQCHFLLQRILSTQGLTPCLLHWQVDSLPLWLLGRIKLNVWMWEFDHKESWVLKNWCFWTVMLEKTQRVPWTARSNQSILKEISPGCSLEGLMLKLQYFGHLIQRTDSL